MAVLDDRARLLRSVAALLLEKATAHPLRIGIDGRTAAGKTRFADDLASELGRSGRQVVRAGVADFHHPAAVRHRQGRFSPDGFYEDARDMAAVRRLLLDPCGAGGSRKVAIRSFDLLRDRPVVPVFEPVAEDAILVIDGSFLLKLELENAWDVLVYLKASAAETRRRGIARDVGALGDEMLVTRLYDLRYEPAFVRYERDCRPEERADLVIEHEDPAAPRLYG